MPVKKKVRKLRRSKRTYKKKLRRRYKKITRRKYRKYRKLRKTKSVYKQQKVKGIKNTNTVDVSHFIMLQSPDIFNVNVSTLWDPNNMYYQPFHEAAAKVLGRCFTVYSTDLMNEAHQKNLVSFKRNLYWKAFNPTLSNLTCGSKFVDYVNTHKFCKYVGVKVSWKPTIKNSFGQYLNFKESQYSLDGNIQGTSAMQTFNGTVYEHAITQVPQDYKTPHEKDMPVHEIYGGDSTANSSYNKFRSNPQFRFWVNFDKQGYTSLWYPAKIMANATAQGIQNGAMFPSRYYFRPAFDEWGQKTWDSALTKSYDMTKPFKFYVRPKIQTEITEAQKNDGGWKQEREMISYYDRIVRADTGNELQDWQLTSLKSVPYMQTSRFYPINPNLINDQTPRDTDQRNAAFYMYLSDEFFFNPILFSWMITCDNIQFNERVNAFYPSDHLMDSTDDVTSEPDRWKFYDVETKGPMNDLGVFKITFYTKFKKEVQYLNVHAPDSTQI